MASSGQQTRNRARSQSVGLNALRQERPKLSESIQNPESFARKLRSKKLLEDSAWKDILDDTCEYSQQLNIIFESVEKCWFNVANAFDKFIEALVETPPNGTFVSLLEQAYGNLTVCVSIQISRTLIFNSANQSGDSYTCIIKSYLFIVSMPCNCMQLIVDNMLIFSGWFSNSDYE